MNGQIFTKKTKNRIKFSQPFLNPFLNFFPNSVCSDIVSYIFILSVENET